jgi:hypothetical protein
MHHRGSAKSRYHRGIGRASFLCVQFVKEEVEYDDTRDRPTGSGELPPTVTTFDFDGTARGRGHAGRPGESLGPSLWPGANQGRRSGKGRLAHDRLGTAHGRPVRPGRAGETARLGSGLPHEQQLPPAR